MTGKKSSTNHLILALLIGLVFHGSAIFFTLEYTYDALIHSFFADHYAKNWFDPWDYRWYTGFTVTGYPPLVHQCIALLSYIGGLKFGLFTFAIISVVLFITGIYRFSLLITSNRKIAGYTALIAVFSSSFVETLHIFGQLPSIIGISVLMHALPEIYLWIRTGRYRYLFTSISLIAVTVTSHHVTPIFGMVFFIFPLIGMVLMDHSRERVDSMKEITFVVFFKSFLQLLKRILVFGGCSLITIIFCILPYWINTKNNPITQVPIPHGSRDNFLEVTSSGLAFFLIPWGVLLLILPYIFYRYYSKRYLFFGFSLTILTILGTGGTTPIPKMMLGENAFNILTLDRFTLWGSIMSLPILGEFTFRLVEGDLKEYLVTNFGSIYRRILGGILASLFLFMTIFTISLGYFRPSQPQKIKMTPIINFLNQDQHDHWRYLPLGFGDQMAWLSAQTKALTVDGNYHSARRLPELTTRAIERLENSKFKGVEGIGSLQQFLTVPEKYNLKYVFSNDKFYDPILYFCGWQRLQYLENGIMVWEKLNVPPLSSILPKEEIPLTQRLLWGIIPLLTVIIAFIGNIQMIWLRAMGKSSTGPPHFLSIKKEYDLTPENKSELSLKNTYSFFPKKIFIISHIWGFIVLLITIYGLYHFYLKNEAQLKPENVVKAYFDAVDFKEFERAYSYIDPKSDISISQYMLEISVTDGLLSSYAKLDAIELELTKKTESSAKAQIKTQWITPLEKIDKLYEQELVKRDGKWYIKPAIYDLDVPPDQFYSSNTTQFFNHGRRRITTQQTHHEDVLKQPSLEVLNAKLIKYKKQYAIIGELQNIDNVPADAVLNATLYNDNDKKLASYSAKYHIKHKLLPKEITSFRINFEGIAWTKTEDSIPATFNPDEFTPIEFEEQPVRFNLQCAANVATKDLYKNVALNQLTLSKNSIQGILFNTGIQEVTVPQLLCSYYNKDKELLWVDHAFLKEGIRPQRKQLFTIKTDSIPEIKIINKDEQFIFINGLPNRAVGRKIIPIRDSTHIKSQLIPFEQGSIKYLKIELNNYIGNPR